MRIALDPVPIVLGIYAYVGHLLARTAERREESDPQTLGRRFARQREKSDREAKRLIRALQADVKTADKLLRKTADVWKISQETDLVNLVILGRGEEPEPQSYVLMQPADVRGLLQAVQEAARGAGEKDDTLALLQGAIDGLDARPGDYVTFGFDPWGT